MLLKLKIILSKSQTYGLLIILLFLLIASLIESFALVSIIPLLNLILDKNNLDLFKKYIVEYTDLFQNLSYNKFVITLSIFLVVFYLLKNAYLSLLNFKQNDFLANLSADLSKRLFEKILKKDFLFFTKNNSSEIIKFFQVDLSYFNGLCQAYLSLTIEIILSLSVIITVLALEPQATLISILVIIPFSVLYLFFSKGYLKNVGIERTVIEKKISKNILESFNGIKEVKIYNIENYLIDKLSKEEIKKARILTWYNTLNQIPRNIFETIAVLTIMIIIIYKVSFTQDNKLLSTLGIFVAATFRLLPSLNRIISSLQSINFFKGSIDIIYNLFNEKNYPYKDVEPNKINFKSHIELENINFSYVSGSKILENINLYIKKGDFIGIMGESGSGKSTLVNIILGLIEPDSGEIKIDGAKIKPLYKYPGFAGYIPQDVFLFDESIAKNITLNEEEKTNKNKKLSEVLKISNLELLIKKLPKGIDSIVGERGGQLSGGQIKRLAIARAFYSNPEFIIFDEATSALDLKTENNFLDEIYVLKKTKTIIFISHNPKSLKDCDKIYNLKKGYLNRIK